MLRRKMWLILVMFCGLFGLSTKMSLASCSYPEVVVENGGPFGSTINYKTTGKFLPLREGGSACSFDSKGNAILYQCSGGAATETACSVYENCNTLGNETAVCGGSPTGLCTDIFGITREDGHKGCKDIGVVGTCDGFDKEFKKLEPCKDGWLCKDYNWHYGWFSPYEEDTAVCEKSDCNQGGISSKQGDIVCLNRTLQKCEEGGIYTPIQPLCEVDCVKNVNTGVPECINKDKPPCSNILDVSSFYRIVTRGSQTCVNNKVYSCPNDDGSQYLKEIKSCSSNETCGIDPTSNIGNCYSGTPPDGVITEQNGGSGQQQSYEAVNNVVCNNKDGEQGIITALGCIPTKIESFVPWLLNWLFGVAGGIAFLLMSYGFILVATSGGDEKKVQGAKETITSAVVGLLVCIFALFILRLIAVNILQIPGIN